MLLKKTKKIAFCGILCALTVVIMLAAYIPFFTYSIPIIAGLPIYIIVIEINKKYALITYFCASVLIFFICEKEAALVYILFFGFYPLLKSIFEQFKNIVFEYFLKIILFNIALVGEYLLLKYVFGLTSANGDNFILIIKLLFFVGCNIVFVLYDIAITKLITLYLNKYQKYIKRLL